MKIHVLFIYIASFLILAACGSTSKTPSSNNDGTVASTKKAPDDDYDGVPNDVDQCPYIYGTARTFGCPDADGDGIQDAEDRCPDEKGYANLLGCLDRDYDGLIDPDDQCPDVYGEKATGCPDIDPSDIDGDGVKNDKDECPELRGMFTANGCPDADGDGIKDELDACPKLFGVTEHHGCPLSKEDMMAIAAQNGHPAKREGIAERGYYESYDGKLYDRNDLLVDVVAGDIVDASGKFISDTKNYIIDKNGYIRNMDGMIVKIDEDGYAFAGTQGLISKKQVNGTSSGGGIKIEGGGSINLGGPNKGGSNKGGNNYTQNNYNNNNTGTGNNKDIYKNSPRNEKPLSPEEAANCNRINLETLTAAIYFDYDAASADQSSLRQLNRVVDAMQKCAKLQLQVGGYADSDGSENYNYTLSERRAKSVLKYIMGQGISDQRLKYNAYGEKYPITSNDSEEGKQQNRRAEIQVVPGN